MSAHTPGPWHENGAGSVGGNDNDQIAHIAWTGDDNETDANTRLVAAAPELLEALEACAAVCSGQVMNKQGLIDALDKARYAIAKAKGGAA